MLSYWEQQSFTHYDHIVIGAGIVGLSTAVELKERYPAARVLILERGLLPTGASSRNAGFACMGSLTELVEYLQTMSEAEVCELFEWRKKGLERLRSRLGDTAIGYAENGSYELIGEADIEEEIVGMAEHLNQLLFPIVHKQTFRLANEKIAECGFSADYTKALIENTCEGEINTGKMLRALTDMALVLGIEIKTGAEVVRFEDAANYVSVEIKDPLRNNILVLHANVLCICTNAFTKQLLPGEDVVPGRGQVLITQPIPGLKFKGIYHFDKGYYYFREIDGRVLLGGGRNQDFVTEATTDPSLNEMIQVDLERKLHDIIMPGTHFMIAQRWAGIMAFGNNRHPIVKAFSEKVFGAFRMSGMGVSLGSEVALQLADMVSRSS